MDLASARWRSVSGTRGVSHLLMSNDLNPARVPTRVIDELRAQEIGEGIVPAASLVTFTKGQKVRILDGAFKDLTAIFDSMDDKSLAQLLLTFMEREIKMTLPAYAVEAA
jgi:transcriptional antiterminator RfaH